METLFPLLAAVLKLVHFDVFPSVLLPFYSPLLHQQDIPLRACHGGGESRRAPGSEKGGWGTGGHAGFGGKLLSTQHSVGSCVLSWWKDQSSICHNFERLFSKS